MATDSDTVENFHFEHEIAISYKILSDKWEEVVECDAGTSKDR